MDTRSPSCGLVPSPPPTTGRLRPTSMWCERAAQRSTAQGRLAVETHTKTKVGDPGPPSSSPSAPPHPPPPPRPNGAQLWQTAGADRTARRPTVDGPPSAFFLFVVVLLWLLLCVRACVCCLEWMQRVAEKKEKKKPNLVNRVSKHCDESVLSSMISYWKPSYHVFVFYL